MNGMAPKGNHWFVDRLDEEDENYHPDCPWGIFLQLEGYVQRLGSGFTTMESAEAFIRDEIPAASDDSEAEWRESIDASLASIAAALATIAARLDGMAPN